MRELGSATRKARAEKRKAEHETTTMEMSK
jgi:hypothetical protein